MCIQINDTNRRRVRRTQAVLCLKNVDLSKVRPLALGKALDAAVICHLTGHIPDDVSEVAVRVQAEVDRREEIRLERAKRREVRLNVLCNGR